MSIESRRAVLTNPVVEGFKGGAVYTSGKRVGERKEADILWDKELPGFGLRYSWRTDTRTYIYQFSVKGGNDRAVTLGRHGDPVKVDGTVVPLSASIARRMAFVLKADVVQGIDPVQQAREQRAKEQREREEAERQAKEQATRDKALAVTLRQEMEHYLENHRTKHGPLRPATQADIRRHFEKNLADWLDLPVTTITRNRCRDRFNEITDRGAPIQANLCFDYLRSVLNATRERFSTDDEYPILPLNPVSRMYKIRRRNKETPRKTRIPRKKIGAVWNMLRERAKDPRNATAADWASLILLTGARRGESRSLMWSQVSLENRTITFTADATKTHEELVLPMSDLLHDILEARKPKNATGYVFPSRSGKTHITDSEEIKNAISEVAATRITLHDIRRSFVDICIECGIDGDQQRLLVNHKSSADVHSRHYANSVERLPRAVALVAAWVQREADVAAGRNVVPLPTAAQREAG